MNLCFCSLSVSYTYCCSDGSLTLFVVVSACVQGIYDRIVANQIRLKTDNRFINDNMPTAPKDRVISYQKESIMLLRSTAVCLCCRTLASFWDFSLCASILGRICRVSGLFRADSAEHPLYS